MSIKIYDMKNIIPSPACHKGQSPHILDVILVSQPKRFTKSLNCEYPLNDFHDIIGGAKNNMHHSKKPRESYYQS